MTTEENDRVRRAWEMNQAYQKRLSREERGEFERSTTDPEFTVEMLSEATGKSKQRVRDILKAAGVGKVVKRQRPNGGAPIRTTIVRWSQLQRLKREFGWP